MNGFEVTGTVNGLSPHSTGLIIYFGYGIRHSVQKRRLQEMQTQINVVNVNLNLVDSAA